MLRYSFSIECTAVAESTHFEHTGTTKLAHLGADTASDKPILKPAALAAMHSVQFRHYPVGPGIALGLFEMDRAGPRLIVSVGSAPS